MTRPRIRLYDDADPDGILFGGSNLMLEGKAALPSDRWLLTADRGRAPLPAELPGLRQHLRRSWEPDALFDVVVHAMPAGPVRNSDSYEDWERRTLDQASLWWVSAEMTDVLMSAAKSVPDVRACDIVPLDVFGLVVLERPWAGLASRPGPGGERTLAVDAFSWGPVRLPALDADGVPCAGEPIPGIAVSSYQWSPIDRGGEANVIRAGFPNATLDGRIWIPLGRSDWPLDHALSQPPWPMDDVALASFMDDRRTLCALMTLLAHGGIADQQVTHPPRGERRRLARLPHTRDDTQVRVVSLRRARDDEAHEPGDGEAAKHDHRWIVDGHWRNQPYGPRRSLRRLQFINPYVKGPEGTPLRHKETVHAWRR